MAAVVFDLAKKNLGLAADPKLEFQSTTLHRLSTSASPIPASAASYWSSFFNVFDTASEVPTLITASTLRQALLHRPENVATLVRVTSRRLVHLVEHDGSSFGDRERAERMAEAAQRQGWRGLTRAMPKGLKEGAAGFIGAGGVPGAAQGKLRELLNCVRVLARVLPFVMDHSEEGGGQTLGRNFLWQPGEPLESGTRTARTDVSAPEAAQFVIEDEDDDDEPSASTAAALPASALPPVPPASTEPPLAVKLIQTVLALLFLPGVTVPAPELDSLQVTYPIWTAGIGSPSSPPIEHSPAHDAAKVEVLRLLLVLLSEPLYYPPHLYALALEDDPDGAANPALQYVVSDTPKKLVLALLCSLINTALGAPNAGTPLSLAGLGNLAIERIGRKSGAESLPTVSAQLLGVLLLPTPSDAPASSTPMSERPPLDRGVSTFSVRTVSGASSAPPAPANDPNAFRFYLSKLHRRSDFSFLFDGIMATLIRPMAVTTQLLPDSSSTVASNVQESLLLLFLLIDSNPRFLDWLVAADKAACDVLVALVFFCLEHKDTPSQIGLVRLCAVLLQLLTANKSLGPKLNSPVELQVAIRSKYGVPGSTADFFIVSICSLIFSTKGALASLYPSLVVCLTNVSPYIKGLTALAATRLVQLFLAFSAPSFILAEDGNVRLVYYLLEAFNNIIHYQAPGNPQVIYALIRAHGRFDMLANFTVSDAVQEIRRKRSLRERDAAAAAAASASTESGGDGARRAMPRRRSSGMSMLTPRLSESTTARDSADLEKRPLTAPSVEDVSMSSPALPPPSPVVAADEGDPNNLTAPSADDLTTAGATGQGKMSEKRKGKMRQGSVSAKDEDGAQDDTPYVGKNGFVPTEGWVASWRDSLPLDTIQIMLAELRPKVASLSTVSSPATTHAVLDFLSSSPLSPDVLPPKPPTKSRRFVASPSSLGWLGSFIWSLIFLRDAEWFDGSEVRLFEVKKRERGGGLRDLGRALSGLTFGTSGTGSGSGGQAAQGLSERPRENGSV